MSPADSDPKSTSGSAVLAADDDRAPAPRPLLSELAARLAQAVRGLRKDSSFRESLEEVIEESERETKDLSSQERLMLANLLKFGELTVADVMVPRADITALDETATMRELLDKFTDANHSRLPIYRETLDDVSGMIHVKDFLRWMASRGTRTGLPRIMWQRANGRGTMNRSQLFMRRHQFSE